MHDFLWSLKILLGSFKRCSSIEKCGIFKLRKKSCTVVLLFFHFVDNISFRNPCRAALEDQQGFGNGRSSWDPVVTLKAIRPDSSAYATEEGLGTGRARLDFWGTNTWEEGDFQNQKWLAINGGWDPDWNVVDSARIGLEVLIDDLLCDVPPYVGNQRLRKNQWNEILFKRVDLLEKELFNRHQKNENNFQTANSSKA